MSYAEFGKDSDIFVQMTEHGHMECVGCTLTGGLYTSYSTADITDHIEAHTDAGDKVPSGILDALWSDDDVNFPDYWDDAYDYPYDTSEDTNDDDDDWN